MRKTNFDSLIPEELAQKFLREYFHFSEEGRVKCLREINRVLELYKDDEDETN
jgi:hypothetical protein